MFTIAEFSVWSHRHIERVTRVSYRIWCIYDEYIQPSYGCIFRNTSDATHQVTKEIEKGTGCVYRLVEVHMKKRQS